MKSHVKAVVIGGGVVGCSVLYHLARHGWTDVMLLERDELTSGSTWHAAGGMHTINGDPNVAKLQKYTISLYKEIEELSGQATGVHLTGGVLLAATEARMDWLRGVVAKDRYLGIDLEEISARQAAELMPLLDPREFVGAVRNREDGHLDPSGVTHAYAKAARQLGAEVNRFTKVEDIVRREDGNWRVITNKGEVIAEQVINAGGLWAREVGAFTLANPGRGEWLIVGSGVAEQYHMRWFESRLPAAGPVLVEPLGMRLAGLALAGPNARDLLASVTRSDVSNAAFPFMAVCRMDIGMASCLVGRVSYTGDLGYEIWMAPEYQRAVFHTLMGAGRTFGIGLFGTRASNALRLEKGYGSWAREYRPIYGPLEAGLDRFVAYAKDADFIGKAGALEERRHGGRLRLRTFVVEATDADVIGDEPIWFGGAVRGWVTSGGYAHGSGVSVALGYVPKEIAEESGGFEIELLGRRQPARIQRTPLFDANLQRIRG